mgnify:FL=1
MCEECRKASDAIELDHVAPRVGAGDEISSWLSNHVKAGRPPGFLHGRRQLQLRDGKLECHE